MATYISKPIKYEAIQIGPSSLAELQAFAKANNLEVVEDTFSEIDGSVEFDFDFDDRTRFFKQNTWVVVDDRGKVTWCQPKAFCHRYGPVSDEKAVSAGDDQLAEYLYSLFRYDGPGEKPVWVPGGNSVMQEVARDQVTDVLAIIQVTVSGEKTVSAGESLQKLLDIQCANGNWDYDPYMHGMANGMILSKSVFDGGRPVFLDAPKKWLSGRQGPGRWSPVLGAVKSLKDFFSRGSN